MIISRGQIQALSATVLASISSASAIFFEPLITRASLTEKTLAAILLAPLLYGAFSLSEILLRRWYFRKVLGEWYYVTKANSSFVDDGYASMKISFNSQGQLHYDVLLFANLQSLLDGTNSKGKALSEAMEYDAERDELHVLYSVNLLADSTIRKGRLFLSLTRNEEWTGDWGSVVDGHAVSQGRLFAARPEVFEEKLPHWPDFDKVET